MDGTECCTSHSNNVILQNNVLINLGVITHFNMKQQLSK